jgi:molybdate-binding protein/DNA-binding XRE family transcriptional regulator
VVNRLAEFRKARGLSAVDLAAHAGVTRQAIYAIEAGTYMPNTAVALRLARLLETSVEGLFELEEEPGPGADLRSFDLLDSELAIAPGEPIQICRVGKHTIGVPPAMFPAYLPVADGVVFETGRASVAGEPENENRLLIAGCDPALSLLADYARGAGIEVVLANGNSARSLGWLREGKIDIAGTHLNDPAGAERRFSSVNFALWEEGLVVARGNPMGIRSVADLARPGLRFMNRDVGSASRRLFESQIQAAGVPAAQIIGSQSGATGHMAAAWAVASGNADCCIAVGSAARRFGLDFIPLAAERFDFVLHKRDLNRKAVENLFDVLSRSRFRRQLEMVAGYDVSHAGESVG